MFIIFYVCFVRVAKGRKRKLYLFVTVVSKFKWSLNFFINILLNYKQSDKH